MQSLLDCVVNVKKTPPQSLPKHKVSARVLGHLLLIAFGVVVLTVLQYQYWYGEFGYHALSKLNNELSEQQRLNAKQQAANDALRADVHDLKTKLVAVEAHARTDLGLIKPGETFVRLSTSPVIYDKAPSTTNPDDVIEPSEGFELNTAGDGAP